MSSEAAMLFGDEHHEKYAKVVGKWAKRVEGVSKLSQKTEAKWGADVEKALGEDVHAALFSDTPEQWKKVKLPSEETLDRYAKIAVKYALNYATVDLLKRLTESVNKTDEAVTAAVEKPSEYIKRAAQTVAQIYDMAKDRLNSIINRRLESQEELTGRKRWVTVGDNSRHTSLHHEVRSQGGTFTYKKEQIEGPRPVGGNPHDWSNCSCYLEYERKDGSWIRG